MLHRENRDERILARPVPEDLIAVAEGALADEFRGLDIRRLRMQAREDERVAELRRA
jgi:hypothetical protein